MKVLSGRQPWWWWLLHGKTIENRKWSTDYRGVVLLHASSTVDEEDYDDASIFVAEAFGLSAANLCPPFSSLPFGGLIGWAKLTRVIARGHRRRDDPVYDGIEGPMQASFWHMQDRFGFVLEDATALPFLPCKGRLGLFDPTPEMRAHALAHGVPG